MSRTRLSAADRRSAIILAATPIFARFGFEGAKTQQIAKAANVSEALVFRHFPTKTALYRAVLRKLIADQDATFAAFGFPEPSGSGLVKILMRTFQHALKGRDASNAEGMRIIFGSLAGDGSYARLMYRRAHRLSIRHLEAALKAARAAGELTGPPMDADNVMAFIEHVSSMMLVARVSGQPAVVYAGDDKALLWQAVLFCGRGIGLSAQFVETQMESLLADKAPAETQSAGKRAKG
jgi:AcrR family transcriptional regulator